MTPFAHVAAGYLATQAADLISPGLHFNTPGIIITGIIAGNIPDLDFFAVQNKAEHRNTWTHAPFFWLLIITALFILESWFGNERTFPYVLTFSLGIFTHFFTDWFAARSSDGGGIRLFYPFSKKHYGLFKLKKMERKIEFNSVFDMFKKEFLEIYMENAFLFYSEVILILFGAAVFLGRSLSVFLGIFL